MLAQSYGAFDGAPNQSSNDAMRTAPAAPAPRSLPRASWRAAEPEQGLDADRLARAGALLADLGCLGPLWLEVSNAALNVALPTPVPLRINSAGVASAALGPALGPALGHGGVVHWLPQQWAWLWGTAGGQALSIEDSRGETLLKLLPRRKSPSFAFACATLLRTYGGGPRIRLDLAPNARPLPPHDAGAHPIFWSLLTQAGESRVQGLGNADLAELTGLLVLDANRLRAMGDVNAVDPGLIPGLLAICADQRLPFQCATGNGGVLVDHSLALAHVYTQSSRRWLRGTDVALSLDPQGLDSAWVVEHQGVRHLRLYDRQGRAAAILRPPVRPGGGETPLWRRLIDALRP